MHPIIAHDRVKTHTSDLHRQAQRDAPGLAARRAGQEQHDFDARSHDRRAHPPRAHPAQCTQGLAGTLTTGASTSPGLSHGRASPAGWPGHVSCRKHRRRTRPR